MAHIFISYSKRDQVYARQLTAKLLAEGFDVWIDDRIDYGENWWTTIVEAIKASAAVVVIMSPDSHQSRWVQREVTLADQWQKPVFPILLAGENWPIYVLTQYVLAPNGDLPEADFYERLAEIVPRGASPGMKVTPPKPTASTTLPNPRRSRPFLVGIVGILVALVLVFGASRLLNPTTTGTTLTPIASPDSTAAVSETLSLTVTTNQVRVRQSAAADGLVVGILNEVERVESLETADETRAKIGSPDQWIHVRAKSGIEGYITGDTVIETVATTSITGVNITKWAGTAFGLPDPVRLQGMGWIRITFNVSYNPEDDSFGNTDMVAACDRYIDVLQPYTDAGLKVIVVFTHQFFGEGAGYVWYAMTPEDWDNLIPVYADLARTAAQCLSDAGVVQAYQIWSEQDEAPETARAVVPIPASDYARLLTAAIQSIRTVDQITPIITGGHVSAPDQGVEYARTVLAAMPDNVRPDGIAIHPYGYGPADSTFSYFGDLENVLNAYVDVLPGKPLWITEWGVLDRQDDDSITQEIADYASGFLDIIETKFPDQVAAAVWYAWVDGLDNGYGLVDSSNEVKEPLYEILTYRRTSF